MTTALQENTRRDTAEPRASERSFGLVFTGVFTLIGLWPLFGGHTPRWWAIAVAALFFVLAFAAPKILAPLNTVWMGVGKIMHKIVSPLVLGLLYTVAVIPTGWFLRARGIDPLRLKRDPSAKTYWVTRDTTPNSFKNQF